MVSQCSGERLAQEGKTQKAGDGGQGFPLSYTVWLRLLMRIAIDTGGTFTDCVYIKEGKPAVLKVLSAPEDPAKAVLAPIQQIAGKDGVEVRHGTTIGTNALLERKGARVAFVTTAG